MDERKDNQVQILDKIRMFISYDPKKTLSEQNSIKPKPSNQEKKYRLPTEQEWNTYANRIPKEKKNKYSTEKEWWSSLDVWNKDDEEFAKTQKKYSEILNKVKNRKSLRYNLNVPEGFSPFEFDDYVDETREIRNTIKKIESKYMGEGFQGEGLVFRPEKMALNLQDASEHAKAKKKLLEIKNKYYNKKFPKGITQEDLKFFEETRKNLKTEINDILKYASKGPNFSDPRQTRPGFFLRGTTSAGQEWMSSEMKKRYNLLKSELENLDRKFGYDGRSGFDKFMDSNWGLVAQVAGNVLLTMLGSVTGGVTWAMVADVLFNVSLGLYQVGRQQQSAAVMSFVFAALPYMRNLYIIAGAPSREICESIAKKVASISLDSADEINAMLKTMTKEEARAWKSIAYLPPSKITPEIENLLKSQKDVLKKITTPSQRFVKGAYKFGKMTAQDLGIAIVAAKAFDKLMEVLKKYGIEVKTEEDLMRLKTWMNGEATQAELDLIYEKIDDFYKKNPTEVEVAKKEGFKIDKLKPKLFKPSKENLNVVSKDSILSKEKTSDFNSLLEY